MSANRGAKIILHSLERSRSQRILWLLEELRLTYEIRPYQRDATQRAPAALKHLHPLGKAPVLSILAPSGPPSPLILAESAAIVEYLVDHFLPPRAAHSPGPLTLPPRWTAGRENTPAGETAAWLRYRYLMHYAEGSLMPVVVTRILMDVVQNAPAPFFVKPVLGIVPAIVNREYTQPNLETHFGFLEGLLGGIAGEAGAVAAGGAAGGAASYLAGTQFTPADILMSYPLVIAEEIQAIDPERFPRLRGYVRGLRGMEGYRRAVRVLEEVEGQAYKPF
ncbi:putative glutathione S-transferase [Aspergillus indologenus CBS 114.80]|uniref:Putative glutathione S-transferase n=1 Tax=Aspergillus indologenus CBS 114.80 TaxID=1450541 RepID=A0A2V5HUP4_9EURO|nr:putative glutathione S-transferase [Aspergillus indologenus CBS 114.80]